MELKPLAYLFIRVNGLIILFYAAIELTYLPPLIRMVSLSAGDTAFHAESMQDLGAFALRVFLQVLAGITFMAKTKKNINSLLADLTPTSADD